MTTKGETMQTGPHNRPISSRLADWLPLAAVPTIASVIATTAVYPIDVVKTWRQVNGTTVGQSLRGIYSRSGLLGFYRGLTPNIFTYPMFWTVYFAANPVAVDTLKPLPLWMVNPAASMISAVAGSAISNPLFVIKNRIQVGAGISAIEAARSVLAGGPLRFMAGFPVTAISNMKLAAQLPLTTWLCGFAPMPIASAAAKLTVSLATYPVDLIRTVQRASTEKISAAGFVRRVLTTEGPRGLYRGFWPYTAMTLPNFVIMMTVSDWITRSLKNPQ